MIYIFITLYIIGVILSYGMSFAFWQREYPTIAADVYWEDMRFSAGFSLLSFVALIFVVKRCGLKYGIKFW